MLGEIISDRFYVRQRSAGCLLPWIVTDFFRQLVIFMSSLILVWYNAQLLTQSDWMVNLFIINIAINVAVIGREFNSLKCLSARHVQLSSLIESAERLYGILTSNVHLLITVLTFYFWLVVIGASQIFRRRIQPEDSTADDNS